MREVLRRRVAVECEFSAQYPNRFRSLNSKPDAISFDCPDNDDYVIPNHDSFTYSSRKNEHP